MDKEPFFYYIDKMSNYYFEHGASWTEAMGFDARLRQIVTLWIEEYEGYDDGFLWDYYNNYE